VDLHAAYNNPRSNSIARHERQSRPFQRSSTPQGQHAAPSVVFSSAWCSKRHYPEHTRSPRLAFLPRMIGRVWGQCAESVSQKIRQSSLASPDGKLCFHQSERCMRWWRQIRSSVSASLNIRWTFWHCTLPNFPNHLIYLHCGAQGIRMLDDRPGLTENQGPSRWI
jgi:hypothetical protein